MIDAYSHMLRISNLGSKTALKIDESGSLSTFLCHMELGFLVSQ